MLAGGKPEDWPEYEGSEEERFTDEMWADIEAQLSASPLVRRVG